MRPLGGATRSEPTGETMAERTENWGLILEAHRHQRALFAMTERPHRRRMT